MCVWRGSEREMERGRERERRVRGRRGRERGGWGKRVLQQERDGDRQREKSVREIGVWEREMLEYIGEYVRERRNTVCAYTGTHTSIVTHYDKTYHSRRIIDFQYKRLKLAQQKF